MTVTQEGSTATTICPVTLNNYTDEYKTLIAS